MRRIVVAAAGAGKTTRIVEEAVQDLDRKSLIVTYTRNNLEEIRRKLYEVVGHLPPSIEICSWFSLLLREFARPYQNSLYQRRIDGIAFVNGRSPPGIPKADTRRYFFADAANIYSDKISEFSHACNELSGGLVVERICKIFDRVFVDEVQDLAGYDLSILELLLRSKLSLVAVGDHRQATYSTNHSQKNRKYAGSNILNKFIDWERSGYCAIEYANESYRCAPAICTLANLIYPAYPKMTSKNEHTTEHDGVFVISGHAVPDYTEKFRPQILRFNRTTDAKGYAAINFGDSKGLTFERVLIFPNGPIKRLLLSGDFSHVQKSAAKFYVAVTRAKQSVAFVWDGPCRLNCATAFP